MEDIYNQTWNITDFETIIPDEVVIEPELIGVFCSLGILGIILNILNIVTLSKSIKQVTYKILIGMAVADLMVSVSSVCNYAAHFFYHSPATIVYVVTIVGSIQLVMQLFVFISNWSAVLLVTIRLLVVTFPLKAAIFASARKVKVSIGLIYIFCTSLHLLFIFHLLFGEDPTAYLYYPILVWILPMALCFVLTVMLLIQFGRAHAKAKEILTQTQLDERVKEQRMLTFTSLLTVTFFIITYLPKKNLALLTWCMCAMRTSAVCKATVFLVLLMNLPDTSNLNKSFDAWNEVAAVLQSCNHAGNFFIYIIANSTLRKNFLQRFSAVNKGVCASKTTPSV